MGHSKKSWHRRAEASPEALFERALLGEDESDRRRGNPETDRKSLQLCRQVERALTLALAGECGDDLLRDVWVESVRPMGGAGQLLVRVGVPAQHGAADVIVRLNARAGRLRTLVAQSICRKRAPSLTFVAVPAGTSPKSGGGHE